MVRRKQKLIKAVDLFAGAGGASTGLVRACRELGYDLDLLAINHWPTAVETHGLNHPNVVHLCEAVEQVNPLQAEFVDPNSGRVFRHNGRLDLLLAGPECTHFSTARGGRPVNAQSRASAWHILKWAQELYIDTILIENVPEWRSWGPIGVDHKPLKSKRGETFNAYIAAFRSLAYTADVVVLNSADYGDPQTRRRLFVQLRRGRHHISWPSPTHAKQAGADLFRERQKHVSAREGVIDWSIRSRSIFNRKKDLRPATIARIIAGLKKFGGPHLQPFIIAMEHGGRVCDIDQPLPTITTARGGALGVAQPFLVQFKGTANQQIPHTAQDVNEPIQTVTGSGADFGVAEPFLLHTTHGGRENSVDEPIPTVTGANRGEIGIVEPFVLQQQSGGVPRSVEDPLPTVAAGGAISVIEPFLVPHRHFEQNGERVDSVDDPLRTITATAGRRFGLAQPFLISAGGPEGQGRTPNSVDEPLPTVLAENHRGMVEPFLVPMYGERDGQAPRTHSVEEPIPTIPATGNGKFGVVEPFLSKYYGNGDGASSVSEPTPTVTTKDRFGLVEPFIVGAGGPERAGEAASVEQPLGTVLGRQTRALVEPFVVPNNTNNTPKSVDEPLPTVTGANRIALVQPVINGYALDIHFRMLQPHELAAAMSFPKDYKFSGTRGDIVKQIGNAWCGELSKALCKAVLAPEISAKKKKRRVA